MASLVRAPSVSDGGNVSREKMKLHKRQDFECFLCFFVFLTALIQTRR